MLKEHKMPLSLLVPLLIIACCVQIAPAAPIAQRVSDQGPIPERSSLLGRLDSTEQVPFTLSLPLRNQSQLAALIPRLYDPSDPLYHHFLSVEDFKANYAPSEVDYAALVNLAKSNGLTITSTSANRLLLGVSGPAAKVESLFSVKLMRYQGNDGRVFHVPDNPAVLPDKLASLGGDVVGLNTGPVLRSRAFRMAPHLQPNNGSGVDGTGYTPSDLRTAYDFSQTTISPKNQTMALVELDTYHPGDITEYVSQYGLGTPNITTVSVDGGVSSPGSGALEVELDIDMSLVLGSTATLRVYEAPNNSLQNAVDIYNQIATDNIAKTISTSWGLDETSVGASIRNTENSIFIEMAGQGQSMIAATGDDGAYDNGSTLSVDDPSSQPYVTGAGGTSLTTTASEQYESESAWSDPTPSSGNQYGNGGGGGISQYWAIPSYQVGIPFSGSAGMFSTSFRDTPDVSLDADPNNGVSVYYTDGRHGGSWIEVGGTSDAAPIWSGILAMVNQQLSESSVGPVGFVNPLLYSLYKNSTKYARDFHDITTGNNLYYDAAPGYDCATGLGSPVGAIVIADLINAGGGPPSFPANISLNPNSAAPGSGPLTITVSGSNFLPGAVVDWNSSALATTYVSGTELTATAPASLLTSTGTANVSVRNPDGTASASVVFTITSGVAPPQLTITALSPSSATAGGSGFTLTVTGTGFDSGATVIWDSTQLSTTFGSATSLTAVAQASLIASAGTATVTVEDPNTIVSNGATFTVEQAAPIINSLSPASVSTGSPQFTLTVNGSGFQSTSEVEWNGSPLATSYFSSTQLTAVVGASLVESPGNVSITVYNPTNGAVSNAAMYTISSNQAAPSITALAPADLTVGSTSETLKILGSGFASSTTVAVNGSTQSSTYVSESEIDVTIPASLLSTSGSLTIVVSTPPPGGGSAQDTISVVNPVPVILTVNPMTANANGNAFTLTVTGSNFLASSAISFGDATIPTTFDSSNQLQGAVPASAIMSVGAISVSVTNPAPGGGTSSTVTFTIQPATLHTFPAGLQMISAPNDYSLVPLSEALSESSPLLAIWDPIAKAYDVTPSGLAGNLHPGDGYWADFSTSTSLYDVGAALPDNPYYSVNLTAGWNMIGTPYTQSTALTDLSFVVGSNAAVPFATATADNIVAPTLYTYNGSSTNYQAITDSIDPYVGYWIFAIGSCTMEIPAPAIMPLK